MKKLLLLTTVLMVSLSSALNAQAPKYSEYYYQRVSLFKILPIDSNDIVFIGNSITDYAEWAEIFNNPNVKNRGISGDVTMGLYDRLDPIIKGKPAKIFLMIGVNDLAKTSVPDSIAGNIRKIADKIMTETPTTKLYIQSILPVNDIFQKQLAKTTKSDVIDQINKILEIMCKEKGITYIDINSSLKEKNGIKLDTAYSNDGLHLMADGYMIWKKIIEKYVQN